MRFKKKKMQLEIGESNERLWPFILGIALLLFWLLTGLGFVLWRFNLNFN
jgi:hypothetical protein